MGLRICYEHNIGFEAKHGTNVRYEHKEICNCPKYTFSKINREKFEDSIEKNNIKKIPFEEIRIIWNTNITFNKDQLKVLEEFLNMNKDIPELEEVQRKVERAIEIEEEKWRE